MARPLWSRGVVLLVASIASLVAPSLAVAHGVAHAHVAHAHVAHAHVADAHVADAHVADGHVADGHHAPADAKAEHHEHHDVDERDDVPVHHRADDPGQPAYPDAHAPDHHHGHEHPTIVATINGPVDPRAAVDAPVVSSPVPAALEQSNLAARPAASWDRAALARPAPDTGPPPALRAPPAR